MEKTYVLLLMIFVGLLNPLYGDIIDRAYEGDLAGVQSCIEKDVDVNSANKNGMAALLMASYRGHLKIVKYLIDNGANINSENDDIPALLMASYRGHLEIVKYLVGKGADVNIKDQNGTTALINASGQGHIEIVKYLVGKGADVHTKNIEGKTALLWASDNGNLDIVEYLVENGANINIKNEDGKTALDIAIIEDRYTEVIEYLESLSNK